MWSLLPYWTKIIPFIFCWFCRDFINSWHYLGLQYLAGKEAHVLATTVSIICSVIIIFIIMKSYENRICSGNQRLVFIFLSNFGLSNLYVLEFLYQSNHVVCSDNVVITSNFTIRLICIIVYENKEKKSPISKSSF